MGISVRTLLENGIYLSIADREFSPIEPNGQQINVAMRKLQLILDSYREQIPFFTEKQLNGESELLNINAASINSMNYILSNSNVNSPMIPVTQDEFSKIATVSQIRAIPVYYWHDQANNAIRVYPLPALTTDSFIIGYLPIDMASSLDEQLSPAVPLFMQLFLEYELAHLLCSEYKVKWPSDNELIRLNAYQQLLNNSQRQPSVPIKSRIRQRDLPIPWLAYLSGNTP